jgi:hypothetical protein
MGVPSSFTSVTGTTRLALPYAFVYQRCARVLTVWCICFLLVAGACAAGSGRTAGIPTVSAKCPLCSPTFVWCLPFIIHCSHPRQLAVARVCTVQLEQQETSPHIHGPAGLLKQLYRHSCALRACVYMQSRAADSTSIVAPPSHKEQAVCARDFREPRGAAYWGRTRTLPRQPY